MNFINHRAMHSVNSSPKISRRNHRATRPVAELRVERLESRQLLSGVTYNGGLLMQQPLVVPIFYGSAWTSTAQANEIVMLRTFLGYITSGKNALMQFLNSHYNVTSRTPGFSGHSYTIGSVSVWSGNSAVPTGNDVVDIPVPAKLSDTTYPAIIKHEIALGHVPAPTVNTVYVLFTPPGTEVFDSIKNGVSTGREWYGYHYVFADSGVSSGDAYYAAITVPGNAPQTLSGNIDRTPLNVFQSLTEILTHEVTESITDPNCDGSGWDDKSYPDNGEIADMGLEPTHYDQVNDYYQSNWLTLLNDYVVPQLWSNHAEGPASLPGAKPAATTQATTLSTTTGPKLTPLKGTITVQSAPAFRWSSIKNANWYELEIEDVTAKTNVTATTATTSIAHQVTAGHTYRWMVRAFSNDGVIGNWSAASQFTVQA
jgi:hypothetical protein